MARPRLDPELAASQSLSLRLTPPQWKILQALVEAENTHLRAAGLSASTTAKKLILHLLEQTARSQKVGPYAEVAPKPREVPDVPSQRVVLEHAKAWLQAHGRSPSDLARLAGVAEQDLLCLLRKKPIGQDAPAMLRKVWTLVHGVTLEKPDHS